ncbi:hypothetical protein RJ45_16950 [Photobacterium gaetbulicola]|uniref:ExoP galactose-binding-like domain-containing protein n=1 Tax=Photobacterium gaetbulicola TaxID=1295392 RepID=A0A0B9G1E1_9GAMM|nr:hypothetical protein RJ45_16950 [Photobacterium gaetbulicola]
MSDNYDYSGGGNTGGGGGGGASNELGLQVPLYHNDPKEFNNPYVMYAVDSDGTETAVDGNALPAASNINVEGEFAKVSPLTVTVTDNQASLRFLANQDYDITKSNGFYDAEKFQGGSVQFYVKTLSYDLGDNPANPNPVLLSMANGDKKFSADITSAVIASAGEQAQFIRVPLNCFMDDGLDLTTVDMAMAIETTGAIQYEFSQARLANNSVPVTPGSVDIQGCLNNNNSKVLTSETSIINQDIRRDSAWVIQGEASDVRVTRGKAINPNPGNNTAEGTIRYKGIEYDEKFDPNSKSFLTFALDKASELKDMTVPRLDMSHYMANGELQMSFIMPATDLPQGDDTYLVLSLDSPLNNTEGLPNGGYPNSQVISYNLTKNNVANGVVHQINIPIRDFFTKPNGSISLNGVQYVEKLATYIEQRTTEDGDGYYSNLAGFKYGLGDIKLVMNPTETPE